MSVIGFTPEQSQELYVSDMNAYADPQFVPGGFVMYQSGDAENEGLRMFPLTGMSQHAGEIVKKDDAVITEAKWVGTDGRNRLLVGRDRSAGNQEYRGEIEVRDGTNGFDFSRVVYSSDAAEDCSWPDIDSTGRYLVHNLGRKDSTQGIRVVNLDAVRPNTDRQVTEIAELRNPKWISTGIGLAENTDGLHQAFIMRGGRFRRLEAAMVGGGLEIGTRHSKVEGIHHLAPSH